MTRLPALVIASAMAVFLLQFRPASSAAEAPSPQAHGQVRIESVEVRLSDIGPVVLLKARKRAIPVFVDAVVAESIHGALTGSKPPRPLTHDLMRSILAGFDGRVSQVVVTLEDRTFRGALTVVIGTTSKVFDSRSSDAIALAIHFGAPILVSEELLDGSGMILDGGPDAISL